MGDENVHKLLELNFRKLGHKTTGAFTAEAALEKYKEALKLSDGFDFVIADLNIGGGIGGVDFTERLLVVDPHANVVVSSGDSQSKVMENYGQYGFNAALDKVYSRKGMEYNISKVLS